jgi:hypothetical protein
MAQITDQYILDTAQFQKGIDEVIRKYDKVGDEAEKAGDKGKQGAKGTTEELKNTEKQAGSLEKSFKKLGAAMIAAFAIQKIKQFAQASVEAANVQLQAEAKLLQALGGREDIQKRLMAQAAELQKTTLYGDEAIIQQQAFLAAQGRSEEQINKTIKAAMDLAAVTGQDLGGAVLQLDKTLEGNAGRLSQLDARFKDLTTEQLRNGEGIDLLAEKYNGFAEQAAKTGTGGLVQLKNAFGDLQEDIGKKLIPVIQDVSAWFIQLFSHKEKIFDAIGKVWTPIIEANRKAWNGIIDIIKMFLPEGATAEETIAKVGRALEFLLLPTRIAAEFIAAVVNNIKLMVGQFKTAGESSSALGKALNHWVIEPFKFLIGLLKDIPEILVGTVRAFGEFTSSIIKLDFQGIFSRTGRAFKSAFDTSVQRNQLDELKKSFEGLTEQQSLLRLQKMRAAFEGNAQAVAMIDAEILKLNVSIAASEAEQRRLALESAAQRRAIAEEQKKAAEELAKKRLEIARKIEDLEIQIIANQEEREDKARDVKFRRLLEDLEANTNLTLAERNRLTGLVLAQEQAELAQVETLRTEARKAEFKRHEAEIAKQAEELAKQRLDLFEKYFVPTMDEIEAREFNAIQEALDAGIVQLEEAEQLKAAIVEKYAKIRGDAEKQLLMDNIAAFNTGAAAFSSAFTNIIKTIGDEQGSLAEFQKALAVFDVAMNQGQAIAAAIAGATVAAKAKGPAAPFVIAGYIASMIGSVVAAFGQVGSILSAEPPRFFEGTESVELGANKKGRDTIPALLNEGEAVIPTDENKQQPGLAAAWIRGDLEKYIHKNWVAPALNKHRADREEVQWGNIGKAMATQLGGWDDYRLHRDLSEQTGVLRSGFASLKSGRSKIRGRA